MIEMLLDPNNGLAREFYYIRHGRTEANAQGLMCGGLWDIELSSEGESQAHHASNILSSLLSNQKNSLQTICVSPLQRAQTTAEVINRQFGVPLRQIEGWREWRIGQWERVPFQSISEQFLGEGEPPDGETRVQFTERVLQALVETLSHPAPALVVSHGAVWLILSKALNIPVVRLDNCHPLHVKATEQGGVLKWNAQNLHR